MAVRKKRSISMPPDVDARIEEMAAREGTSYSAWLVDVARKEFMIRQGLKGVAAFEDEHGPFTPDELSQARAWASKTLSSRQPRRRSA